MKNNHENINKNRWFLTLHSLQRVQEMGLGRLDVTQVLDDPEITYPGYKGRTMAQRGRLAVIAEDDIVVTVMPRTLEQYQRPEAC